MLLHFRHNITCLKFIVSGNQIVENQAFSVIDISVDDPHSDVFTSGPDSVARDSFKSLLTPDGRLVKPFLSALIVPVF